MFGGAVLGSIGARTTPEQGGGAGSDVLDIPTKILEFTPSNGPMFTLFHGLNTQNFVYQMYKTDISPQEEVLPLSVVPSGSNDVTVSLDVPMHGKLLLIGI
jgi:hypothetical protein